MNELKSDFPVLTWPGGRLEIRTQADWEKAHVIVQQQASLSCGLWGVGMMVTDRERAERNFGPSPIANFLRSGNIDVWELVGFHNEPAWLSGWWERERGRMAALIQPCLSATGPRFRAIDEFRDLVSRALKELDGGEDQFRSIVHGSMMTLIVTRHNLDQWVDRDRLEFTLAYHGER